MIGYLILLTTCNVWGDSGNRMSSSDMMIVLILLPSYPILPSFVSPIRERENDRPLLRLKG